MSSKDGSKFLAYQVYLAVRVFVAIMQMIPVPWALAIARMLGRLAYLIDKRHRKVAAENLRHAFPELSESEIDRRVRASYQHLCVMAVETVLLMRKLNSHNAARFVRDKDLEDSRFAWDLVLSNRPVIVMTGHVGNWEVMSLSMALQGARASIVARPLDNHFLDRYIREFRTSAGMQIVDKQGAAEVAGKVLTGGGKLGLVGDQDAGPKGMFVNFFGRPASTFKSIALLAIEYQAPILVLGCVRTGEPLRHLVFLEDAIMPAEFMNDPAAVRAITQRYTSALERIVRRNPEQYFWFHRRWKSMPPVKKMKQVALNEMKQVLNTDVLADVKASRGRLAA